MRRTNNRVGEKVVEVTQPTIMKRNNSDDVEISANGDEKHQHAYTTESDTTIDITLPTGVKKAEAITLSWSKKTLILIYI